MDFVALVNARLQQLNWTPYRLARDLEGRVTKPTIYNFLNGQPVKSDTLAAIFEAVGLVVVEGPRPHVPGTVAPPKIGRPVKIELDATTNTYLVRFTDRKAGQRHLAGQFFASDTTAAEVEKWAKGKGYRITSSKEAK